MGKCIIVCNGDVENYELFKDMFDKDSFVICADGGSRHLRKVGIFPNIIMGDLDSSTLENVKYFQDLGTEVRTFPTEKDYTDTELAFLEAINMGFKSIKILSCIGQRFDHTLANIFLLKKGVDSGVECCIQNENNEITMLKGDKNNQDYQDHKDHKDHQDHKEHKEHKDNKDNKDNKDHKEINMSKKIFENEMNFKISLLPISLVCKGVSITGVKYPLNNATVKMGEAIGVSNEFIEKSALVTIEEGLLLVILSKD